MKNTYAIKLHSIVDIITNSSSEIFACKLDNAPELKSFAMEILECIGGYGNGGVKVTKIDKLNLKETLYWNNYILADYIPQDMKDKIGFVKEGDFKVANYENYIAKLVKKHGDELLEALKDVYIIDCDQNMGGIQSVFEHYFGAKK